MTAREHGPRRVLNFEAHAQCRSPTIKANKIFRFLDGGEKIQFRFLSDRPMIVDVANDLLPRVQI